MFFLEAQAGIVTSAPGAGTGKRDGSGCTGNVGESFSDPRSPRAIESVKELGLWKQRGSSRCSRSLPGTELQGKACHRHLWFVRTTYVSVKYQQFNRKVFR